MTVAHRAIDRFDQMRRRLEPERDRVADIEVANLGPGGLDALRLGDDRPNRIGKSTNAGGSRDGGRSFRSGHVEIVTAV